MHYNAVFFGYARKPLDDIEGRYRFGTETQTDFEKKEELDPDNQKAFDRSGD
jgi:hypothetical protein